MNNELLFPFIGLLSVTNTILGRIGLVFTGNAAWPAANRALYLPFVVPGPFHTDHFGVVVTTSVGTVDLGIYTFDGRLIVSTGAVATPALGVKDVAIPLTRLVPGTKYYMAMSVSTTSAGFLRSGSSGATWAVHGGVKEEDAAHPLPTIADLTTDASAAYFPMFAIGRVGFSWTNP